MSHRMAAPTVAAAISAGLGLALSASSAFAGDPSCLWNKAPEAVRAQVLERDPPTPTTEDLVAMQLDEHAAACGVTDQTAKDAGSAVAGYVTMQVTVHWFEKRGITTRANLEAGWAAIPPELKAKLIALSASLSKEPFPQDAIDAFFSHAGIADLSDSSASKSAGGEYLAARAVVEAYKDKF